MSLPSQTDRYTCTEFEAKTSQIKARVCFYAFEAVKKPSFFRNVASRHSLIGTLRFETAYWSHLLESSDR
jgi:hypothetical protein